MVSLYKAEIPMDIHYMNVSYFFELKLNDLPLEYDEEKYLELLNRFGTHVVVKTVLGGRGRVKTLVKSDYFRRVNEDVIKSQAGLDFEFLKGHASFNRSRRENSQEYVENTEVKTDFLGGNSALGFDKWKEWETTIPVDPENVDYEVEPVYKVLKDTHPKKRNIITAYTNYIKKHQREIEGPRTVPDCKHIRVEESEPQGVIKIIGTFDCYRRNSGMYVKGVYLIDGPNSKDECLTAYSYFDNQSNQRRNESFGITYADRELYYHFEKSCEQRCQRNGKNETEKHADKYCYSDWNNWSSGMAIYPNNHRVILPPDRYITSGTLKVSKNQQIFAGNYLECQRLCPFGNFASFVAVYQHRIIPDHK